MADFKEYRKKRDTIRAYQVPENGTRDTVQMNQSGFYDSAYHGNITTSMVGWVEPGDYVVELPNGLFFGMRKEDFERMYELADPADVPPKTTAPPTIPEEKVAPPVSMNDPIKGDGDLVETSPEVPLEEEVPVPKPVSKKKRSYKE